MELQITISPRRLTGILSLVVLGLTLASLAGSMSTLYLHPGTDLLKQVQKSYIRLFYVDWEANIPTWYQASTLLFCSIILATIARGKRARRDPYVWHWAALAIIFLAMSIDEEAVIHEMAIKPLRQAFHMGGLLYYAWVVPGAAAVLLFALAYLRFLWSLPPRTRLLFAVAGVIYVGGALGVEAMSGLWADRHGEENLIYMMISTVEELMEMIGIIVFIHALLDYTGRHMGKVTLHVDAVGPHDAATALEICNGIVPEGGEAAEVPRRR